MLLSFVDRLETEPGFTGRIDGLKRDLLARPSLPNLGVISEQCAQLHRAQCIR